MTPEKLLISCILNDIGIHDVILPDLKPEYFVAESAIGCKLIEMYSKHKAIDTYTLIAELPDQISHILELNTLTASAAHSADYLARMKDDYLRRQMKRYFSAELTITDDPFEFLNEKLVELSGLQESVTPHLHRTLLDIISDTLDELHRPESETFGIPSPLTYLNNLTHGWQPSDLIILAGRPSRGKTAFALANVRSACEAGKRVVVFSLEMKDTQLMKRLIYSHDCGYDEAGGRISNWKLDIFERGGIGLDYVVGNCRTIKKRSGLDFVVIDYLGLMTLPKAENRAYQIGAMTRGLKALAKELDIPIMLLVQLNRDIEKRNSHSHQLSDLRESGDIEQDADVVIFVSRPIMDGVEEDKQGTSTTNLTVLEVAKNRNGKAPVTIKAWNNEKVNRYEDWPTLQSF
jgi:replicative DNA helicase